MEQSGSAVGLTSSPWGARVSAGVEQVVWLALLGGGCSPGRLCLPVLSAPPRGRTGRSVCQFSQVHFEVRRLGRVRVRVCAPSVHMCTYSRPVSNAEVRGADPPARSEVHIQLLTAPKLLQLASVPMGFPFTDGAEAEADCQ